MERERVIEILKEIFNRRAAGDIDGMLEFVADDIVCFPRTTWGFARYLRPIVGKAAVREAFYQRHINYINAMTKMHRMLIDGDEAVVHRTTTIVERGGGGALTFDAIDFFRFREGLVIEFCELPDGAARETANYFPH